MAAKVPLVTCYYDTDIVHAAYAVCGLAELSDAGTIGLRFGLTPDPLNIYARPFTMALRVEMPGRERPYRLCVDFHDNPDYLCDHRLRTSDLYFKSNFSAVTLATAPAESPHKLRAFGPYFPCRATRDRRRLRRALGTIFALSRHRCFHRTGRTVLQMTWETLNHVRRLPRYLTRQRFFQYESPPNPTAKRVNPIFFNPQCWPESRAEVVTVNAFRAEVIVKLKAVLGDRFLGGFRDGPLARLKYPQAVQPREFPFEEYVELTKQSPLIVYTNGLNNCFSWRLGESFAGGKGIVSERIVNDAGFPLDEAHGVIQVDTADEMVATTLNLLEFPSRLEALSANSWRTYETFLRPARSMQRVLDEVAALETRQPERATVAT